MDATATGRTVRYSVFAKETGDNKARFQRPERVGGSGNPQAPLSTPKKRRRKKVRNRKSQIGTRLEKQYTYSDIHITLSNIHVHVQEARLA
jgi:hypothetical protein